ncbi:MAG: VCBS repeat-containing protein [Planctomycetota bacterium]|nr:VCBS repeat-containing protein [Planctomycetota bacterium]
MTPPTASADLAPTPSAPPAPVGWEWPRRGDPRWPFAAILSLYCLLGVTALGFNRSWTQMLVVVGAGCLLDVALGRVARGRRVVPLSAYISCCSLALLLNYSHGSPWLLVPVLLTIGSKHLLTVGGRHVFNPSMFGVAVSLLVTGDLVTTAPAYQWAGGSWAMSAFIVMAGLSLFVFRIGRGWLICSFLVFYALQTAFRAWVMRHHLPPEMLFLGTLGAPPFFIFTFYMLTDPATSPPSPKKQVLLALAITVVDLWLHTKESVFTFFYAALFCATVRFLWLQAAALRRDGPRARARAFLDPGYLRGLAIVLTLAAAVAFAVQGTKVSAPPGWDPGLRFERLGPERTGIDVAMGDLLERTDPRVAHIAKWILSVGDAVAVADVDLDGRMDLFFTNVLKADGDRCALYRNVGGMRFERVPLPEVVRHQTDFRTHGAPAGATFCDWDGDGDPDLVLAMGFGRTRFLRNRMVEDGALSFEDVTDQLGIDEHSVSLAATFLDLDRDGRLDLLLTNALPTHLPGYDRPTPLNIFDLPPPEHEGDRRALAFMHDGWHDAANGGVNLVFRGRSDGTFERLDPAAVGLTETRWSLAVGTADLDRDGWTDLYIANDFGPDELYLNRGGRFESIKGRLFADIGRDTYKGMNVSIADFDRNGWLDVYVSNVHHALQAEGSLLWMTRPSKDPRRPSFTDEATQRGALNERRFGWGAAAGDLDLDGWADIVQANGMVDDRLDRRFDEPQGWFTWLFRDHRDYWYVNHKLMQSGPELHTYADMWGDIRGRTIYPNEARRVYLNRGAAGEARFVDVAALVGVADPDNSRGVALVDLDDDGDLDLVITNQHGPPSIYENTLRSPADPDRGPAFLGVRLVGDGVTTHREAIGTQVVVKTADGEQVQERALLTGFSGQGDPRLLFGLGGHRGPVEVTIRWYGGEEQRLVLEPNRYHVVRQPERP